jgi:hypothetical protein
MNKNTSSSSLAEPSFAEQCKEEISVEFIPPLPSYFASTVLPTEEATVLETTTSPREASNHQQREDATGGTEASHTVAVPPSGQTSAQISTTPPEAVASATWGVATTATCVPTVSTVVDGVSSDSSNGAQEASPFTDSSLRNPREAAHDSAPAITAVTPDNQDDEVWVGVTTSRRSGIDELLRARSTANVKEALLG